MSNDPVSVRLGDGDLERLDAFAEDEGTTRSKALEKALSRGLEVYGFGPCDGWHGTPPIERVTAYGTITAASMAAALGGVHLATSLSMLGPMAMFLTVALALVGVRAAEPRVSTLLFKRGENA